MKRLQQRRFSGAPRSDGDGNCHRRGNVTGMVGGQVADLEAEGKPVSPEMLEYIHRSKLRR